MPCSCSPSWLICLSVTSTIFALTLMGVALFVPPYIDQMLSDGIYDMVIITNQSKIDNTDGYQAFIDNNNENSVLPYYKVYIFNITNVHDIMNNSKPIYKEIGPYIFREHKQRLNLTFSTDLEGRATAKFKTYQYYIFDEQESFPLTLNDSIVTVNLGFQLVNALSSFATNFLTCSNMNNDTQWLVSTKTAYEMLFGSTIQIYNFSIPGIINSTNVTIPVSGYVTNMSMQDALNNEFDEVYTGADPDQYLTRSFYKFTGMDYVRVQSPTGDIPMWGTDEANRIRGTDGTQFHMGVKKGQQLEVYVSELYREVPISYNTTINFKDIELYRFMLSNSLLQNVTENNDTAAYYANCPMGLLNISRAFFGIPLFVSKPHFLDGDPELAKNAGLVPVWSDHQTTVDVEPMTGFAMKAHKRMQLNMRMSKIEETCFFVFPYTVFNTVGGLGYWPILWFEESGEIPDNKAHDFVSKVYGAQKLSYYLKYISYSFSIIFVLVAIALMFRGVSKRGQVEDYRVLNHT